MENLVFAILMLGCDHALDQCAYVPMPVEYYASREECEDILPLAFHEAETFPVAVGDCVAVPRDWTEKDITFEWSIDGRNELKIAVIGPGNAVFGDQPATKVAAGKSGRLPTG